MACRGVRWCRGEGWWTISGLHARRWGRVVFGVWLLIPVLTASCTTPTTYPRPSVTLPLPTEVTALPSVDPPAALPPSTVPPNSNDDGIPDGIPVAITDDLAAVVAAAQPGSTFVLKSGVHRASETVPKDGMTFVGLPGTVLSGAIVLEGFDEVGDRWQLDGVSFAEDAGGECIAGYQSCGMPNDLFIDGVMLWRVDEEREAEPGTWWGGDGRIVVADDPEGRVVELSSTPHAFIGAAADVTIRDLVIEMYAVPSQEGAVQAQDPEDGPRGSGWLIEDVEIRFNHAAGLRTGDSTMVRRVFAHDNGQLGIAVSGGRDVAIVESELARNNVRGYLWEWEGGGGKFTRTDGLVVRDTFAHDNLGPGLWTDIDAANTLYERNRTTDNLGPGIYHEISGSALIQDNEVSGNGFGNANWAWGAGILISASFDVEVTGNRVFGNADGIAGVQQSRGSGALGERLLARVHVHDNEIELSNGVTGVVQDVGDPSIYADREIRFESNHYRGVGNRQAYAWADRYLTAEEWVAAGQDVNGTWK